MKKYNIMYRAFVDKNHKMHDVDFVYHDIRSNDVLACLTTLLTVFCYKNNIKIDDVCKILQLADVVHKMENKD